jgi:hypothetical protein
MKCPRCGIGIDDDNDGNCGVCAKWNDAKLREMTGRPTPADKLAAVVNKWRRSARKAVNIGTAGAYMECFEDVEPILAELQRAQGRELLYMAESVSRLIHAWDLFHSHLPDGEYKGLGEMRMAITYAKKHLLSAPTPAEQQEIVNVGDRKFTRTPNIVGDLQEIVSDGSTPAVPLQVNSAVPLQVNYAKEKE